MFNFLSFFLGHPFLSFFLSSSLSSFFFTSLCSFFFYMNGKYGINFFNARCIYIWMYVLIWTLKIVEICICIHTCTMNLECEKNRRAFWSIEVWTSCILTSTSQPHCFQCRWMRHKWVLTEVLYTLRGLIMHEIRIIYKLNNFKNVL